jgi:hypothetical protein
MAYYIIRFDDRYYANEELCKSYFAGGEKTFIKQVARGELIGKLLMDQILYPVTEEERKLIRKQYDPQEQDFDTQYRKIQAVFPEEINNAWAERLFPGAAIIRVPPSAADKAVCFRSVQFIPLRYYNQRNKYYWAREKMARVRIFKYWYIALNAVNITADRPVIVTIR